MENIKNVFIAVDKNGVYLGTFETQELARLYGKDFANGEVSVISPVRNYPDQDQVLLGTFQVVEPEPVEETPEVEAATEPEPEPVEETTPEPAVEAATEETTIEGGTTSPATDEAPPKPRQKRTRLSPERIQECCELVVGMMEAGNPYKRKQFRSLGIKPNEWTKTIRILLDQNKLRQEGIKKGACYFLVTEEDGSNGSNGEAVEEEACGGNGTPEPEATEATEAFPVEPSMAQIAAEAVTEEPEATVED